MRWMKALILALAVVLGLGLMPAAASAPTGPALFGHGSELYLSPAYSDTSTAHVTFLGLGWRPGEQVVLYGGVAPDTDFGGAGAATVTANAAGRFRVTLLIKNPTPGRVTPLYMIAESKRGRMVTPLHTFVMAPFIFNY